MRGCRAVTYIHILFEAHQIVFANWLPSESLYAGAQAVGSLSSLARLEVLQLFPSLAGACVEQGYGPNVRVYSRKGKLPESIRDLVPVTAVQGTRSSMPEQTTRQSLHA